MNDLGATGHSLSHLPPEDFCVLNEGQPVPGGTRALLAAGTGLGESILFWDGSRYHVVPSEGGHSDFAPHTAQQIELLRFVSPSLSASQLGADSVRPRLSHRSRIPCTQLQHPIFEDPGCRSRSIHYQERACTNPARSASRLSISGLQFMARRQAIWRSKCLALGGVYVAGGIAVKIIAKMKDGTFLNAFKDKWHFTEVLSNMPVSVVLNESAPLIGAAYEAFTAIDKGLQSPATLQLFGKLGPRTRSCRPLFFI